VIIRGIAEGKKKWIHLMTWYNAEVFGNGDIDDTQVAEISRIEEALEDSDDEQSWGEISYLGNRTFEAIPVDESDYDGEVVPGGEQPILVCD
jgi:hypothetical protein